MSRLRGKPVEWRDLRLENGGKTLRLPKTNTLEIMAEIDLQTATRLEFGFKSGINDAPAILVIFTASELRVMDAKAPLSPAKGERQLKLRIFMDRSVLEVFANETVSVTKTIAPLDSNATLEIRADVDTVNVRLVQAWPMKMIW